jgi:membrane-associated phospholipid phosphatase
MGMHTKLKQVPTAYRWFFAAGVFLILFMVYTIIFSTGVLLIPTLRFEQLLLHRPVTRFDCVLSEWKVFGEAPASALLTLVLGLACLWLGYRRRVLAYLFLLLLVGIGVEYVGKDYLAQSVPNFIQRGMDALSCPQLYNQPRSVKFIVTLGVWWQAPPIPEKRLQRVQRAATAALDSGGTYSDYGYPSGHAIRWIFIGLLACWLFWRQVRYRILRWLLMALAFAIALGGGFAQVYLGFHLTTDLVAGYLFGASTACCAIGLLLLNETRNRYTL